MSQTKNVFISYKSEEFEKANWVKKTLEHNGITCWMAPSSIKGGASYASEIPKAIRECVVFVLILSEKAQDSKWVPRELDQAINSGKIIMPFMLEDCFLKDDFNFYLTNVQRYEAYQNKAAAVERMIRDIKAVLEKENTERMVSSAEEQSVLNPEELLVEDQKKRLKEVPKQPKEKKNSERKIAMGKKISKVKILGGAAAAIAVLVIGGVILNKMNEVTIAGNVVKKDQGYLNLKDVTVSANDLENIKKIEELYSISIENCTFPEELLKIISIPSMSTIQISNCNLTNEQFAMLDFQQMEELNYLEVDNNPELSDLSPAKDAADTLYRVSFSNTAVKDISFLEGAEHLYQFEAENNQLEDISVLGTCENLNELYVDGNKISSLEALKNCKKLRDISVNGNALTSLKGLENCIELTHISAGSNQLSTLEGLENATLLTRVFLNNNQLTDISVLAKSAQTLTGVYLNHNQLKDLLALENCTILEYLSADSNQIATLESLESCTALTKISVEKNELTSLDGLENCKELDYIDASDNQIANTQALADLRVDPDPGAKVDLSNNKLTEFVMAGANDYWFLDLTGNAIQNMSSLTNSTGYRLAFDYAETIDLEKLVNCYNNFWIMNCPLDKQMAVKELLSGFTVTFDDLSEMESAKQASLSDVIKGDAEYYDKTEN